MLPLVNKEETAIAFFKEIGLIPKKQSTPPECCGLPMKVNKDKSKKLGWRWVCCNRKNSTNVCRNTISPTSGTFFENTKIGIADTLAIIIHFASGSTFSAAHLNMQSLRQYRNKIKISSGTVIDYYSFLREITEVIASHSDIILDGEGKTVQIDETFLTKRKYHRGRVTSQMTMTVLGIYCKEDKTGLFFHVKSKSKKDLWPYIHRYVHKQTAKICTDGGRQYFGVAKTFSPGTVHLVTDHSKGEFVNRCDSSNTINDLENQNKLLKIEIISRRSTLLIHQYMALHFYKKHFLKKIR